MAALLLLADSAAQRGLLGQHVIRFGGTIPQPGKASFRMSRQVDPEKEAQAKARQKMTGIKKRLSSAHAAPSVSLCHTGSDACYAAI